MERKTKPPTFIDSAMQDLGDPRMSAKLDRLGQAVPWDKLAAPILATYGNATGAGGRPNVQVVMMLKLMMLQKWFNLGDAAMEGMLRDRISFRRFVGIGVADEGIDETTMVVFRKRLREHGLASTLFDAVVAHLEEAGLVVREGTLVDATIIEAPRGRTRGDGVTSTRDRGATFTKKHGRTHHGYKAHIAADGNGVVMDYRYDTAAPHDSRHADELMAREPDDGAVFADSAYMDKGRRAALEKRGVFYGVIQRRVRGQEDLSKEQKKHNTLCSRFRAFVEHPFAWMKQFGSLRRTRYRGLARNALDFALTVITHNFRRAISLADELAEERRAEERWAAGLAEKRRAEERWARGDGEPWDEERWEQEAEERWAGGMPGGMPGGLPA